VYVLHVLYTQFNTGIQMCKVYYSSWALKAVTSSNIERKIIFHFPIATSLIPLKTLGDFRGLYIESWDQFLAANYSSHYHDFPFYLVEFRIATLGLGRDLFYATTFRPNLWHSQLRNAAGARSYLVTCSAAVKGAWSYSTYIHPFVHTDEWQGIN